MLRPSTVIGQFLLITIVLGCAAVFGQQTPAGSTSGVRDFPVVMSQKVVAGTTPVGTKVEAKLEVATLLNGTVLPRNAVFSGEVIESVAKSGSDPSRLAIRMDSVTWKKGSAPIKVYLTAWYYPVRDTMAQNLAYGPDTSGSPKGWNGAGAYPDPNSPASQPFPGRDSDASMPNTQASPSSSISNRRVLIRDVEPGLTADGVVAIVSARSTIKLDKVTTYVLAAQEVQPPRK